MAPPSGYAQIFTLIHSQVQYDWKQSDRDRVNYYCSMQKLRSVCAACHVITWVLKREEGILLDF